MTYRTFSFKILSRVYRYFLIFITQIKFNSFVEMNFGVDGLEKKFVERTFLFFFIGISLHSYILNSKNCKQNNI